MSLSRLYFDNLSCMNEDRSLWLDGSSSMTRLGDGGLFGSLSAGAAADRLCHRVRLTWPGRAGIIVSSVSVHSDREPQ